MKLAAREKSCLRFFLLALFAWLLTAAWPEPILAQQAVIQRIDIVGNRRYPRDTIRARMFVREGDPYSEDALRRDFQALWNTQYFEDIRLEVEDSPDRPSAKIIVFYVKERPIIRRIEYCKIPEGPGGECRKFDAIPESEILDRFKERKVGLSVESSFDPTRIKKAEVALKELLSERGRQFAVIKPTYQRIPATNAIKLLFNIDQGPKVKVGKILIEGNQAFSDRKIIRVMRHSRPYAIPLGITYWNVFSKTYDRRKLSEDLEIGIRGLYQDNGYFTVTVKEPVTDTVDINRAGLPGPWPLVGRKRGKATNITIPLEEGERFRMGRLFVRSSDPEKGLFFKTEFLQQVFPLKEGDLFAVDKVRKALDEYRKLYGQWGFIDFTATPLTDVKVAEKTVNLTLEFDEQKQFIVRRIEFTGNTTTRDKVIRRELYLDEGDLYNTRYWELSILKLNQLDYFEQIKDEHTEVKRNLKDATVDLTLKLKEKGKQSIGLTGGVSGLSGSFIGLSYQTNNFLGLGETLTFSAEFGDRQRNFLFGFTEPYLFDRPIATGFTIFSSRFSFDQSRETSLLLGQRVELDRNLTQNYDQNSSGFTLFASYPLKRLSFARVGMTYTLSKSNIAAFSQASQLLFENLQFRGFAGPSALSGILSSKVTPTFIYNTVDNPINPTRGKSLFVSLGFEGGPLQGNVNTLIEVAEAKYFRPINKGRNVLGFRLQTALATGYSGKVLPPFNRFYAGGEDTIRGFDIRSVTPVAFIPTEQTVPIPYVDPTVLDGNGNPTQGQVTVPILINSITFPGGDAQAIGNFEYRIPIVGPVSMALFYDVGLNGALRRSQLQLNPEGVGRLQALFPKATIKNQLDLASGTNFKLRSSTGVEFVVQLPVLNAPFRVYWAYNLARLRTVVTPPPGSFNEDSPDLRALRIRLPDVYRDQVIPQLDALVTLGTRRLSFSEPLKTFRFTVSRTF